MNELPQAHRPRPDGSFDATVITFAAMGLFDALTAGQRAQVLLPHADPGRTHWNFLPESGRHGIPLGDLDRRQEALAHRMIAESMSIPAYARVVQVMTNEHLLRELVAGDGEQRRHSRSLRVQRGPSAGPRAVLDLHDRGVRPDPGEHRVRVAYVPGEFGELPHRIVAGLRGIILLGRRDQPLPAS